MTLILTRLVFLQIKDAEALVDRGENQRLSTVPLHAERGSILDRYGREMAISLEARAVYVDPRYVVDPAATADKLAPLLEMRPMEIQTKLMGSGHFVYLKRQVDEVVADRIEGLELPGIGFLRESKRYYPSGAWGAPQVVGIHGSEDCPTGCGGLELTFDDVLAGVDGERTQEIDPGGRPIPQGVSVVRPAVPGQDVMTTIDPELQYQAQVALEHAVDTNDAKGGTVIMINPKTGEIYAMATYYPPAKKKDVQESVERTTNPAVTNVYEPGSVNKVITASAAVQEGAVDLREVFHVYDSIDVYDYTIHDAESHGMERMMLGDIITHSSNVGTIMVAKRVGSEGMASYLAKFGYGQPTGVGLPGESGGILPQVYEWSGTSMATIPIGQGVSVTPLQMVNVYATVANDGVWTQPQIVKGTIDAGGVFHPAPEPERRRVISPESAATVTGMLSKVVAEGTGTNAQIPGYWVAGKTGTAMVPSPTGGYTNKFVGSFIGYLPASDPEVVIGVIIDEPSVQYYGGTVAAPVFQLLAKQAIARLRIPPGDRPDFPPSAMGKR